MNRTSSHAISLAFTMTLAACGKEKPPSLDAAASPVSTTPSSADAGVAPPAGDGVTHTDTGGFTVWFPSEPKTTISDVDTEVGAIKQTQLMATVGNTVTQIIYSDTSTEVLKERSVPYMLDNIRKGAEQAFPGVAVKSAEPWTLADNPGLRLVLTGTAAGSVALEGEWRIALVGARTLQIISLWPNNGGGIPAESKRFFESFALTDAAPKEKTADLTQKTWATYKEPGGAFEVEAPGEPKVSEQEVPMGEFKATAKTFVWTEGMYGKYMLSLLTLPPELLATYNPSVSIDAFEKTWVTKWNGTNATHKPYGDPGVEIAFDIEEQGNLLRVRAISTWKKPRLFQILTRLGDLEDKGKVERFLTSFKLTAP